MAWVALAVLGVLQAAAPVAGFSPQAESVLEVLRGRIASGAAGEEAYGAFLDLLAEGDDNGCEAWWVRPEFMPASGSPASRSEDMRFGEIRSALNEVCPEPVPEGKGSADPDDASGQGKAVARSKRVKPPKPQKPLGPPKPSKTPRPTTPPAGSAQAHTRLSVSQSVLPRRERSPASPRIQGTGTWSRGAWNLSLEEYRTRQRYLRLGSAGLSLHAGHVQPALARTRLGFVAGGRFYSDRSGVSGAEGALFSPQRALDGVGVSAALGGWNLEAAGAWNRLLSRDSVRRDVLAYVVGIAREGNGDAKGAGVDFRFQAARLRSEPGTETPADLGLAGARLGGTLPGLAQWGLGAAASLPYAAAAPGKAPAFRSAGAYLETSLASPPSHVPPSQAASSWRLEARQATEHWANPLQSPRGILRDTLAGEWIVRGGGEGGVSSRTGFPLAAAGPWSAGLQGRMGAAWSLAHGLLAQSGSLGIAQAWAPWALESGVSLGWHRRGPPGAAASAEGGTDADAGESGGFAQGLAWSSGPWSSRATFLWRGGDYSGDRPAPLSLDCRHGSWSARLYTGDIRDPGSYLRAEARQAWKAGGRLKVEQEIRLPWTREGLAADMGYQLRLEAAL